MTIWKFQIDTVTCIVPMPEDAKILSVNFQMGTNLFVWAAVDPNKPVKNRNFLVVGTGINAEDVSCGEFVGTAQYEWRGNYLVLHVFDKGYV